MLAAGSGVPGWGSLSPRGGTARPSAWRAWAEAGRFEDGLDWIGKLGGGGVWKGDVVGLLGVRGPAEPRVAAAAGNPPSQHPPSQRWARLQLPWCSLELGQSCIVLG